MSSLSSTALIEAATFVGKMQAKGFDVTLTTTASTTCDVLPMAVSPGKATKQKKKKRMPRRAKTSNPSNQAKAASKYWDDISQRTADTGCSVTEARKWYRETQT